ncbi:MAG: hypothetical protein LBS27_11925 [Bifidobacteriaceae bacterium]|nr:hypothetical protein [Bifidobacteriaceae bacterium]
MEEYEDMRARALGARAGPAPGWAAVARSGMAAWIAARGPGPAPGAEPARRAAAPDGLVAALASMVLSSAG